MLDLVLTNNNYVICDIVKTNPLEYNSHTSEHDSFTLNLLKPLNNSSYDINNNKNIDNNHINFNYAKANTTNLKIALFNINWEDILTGSSHCSNTLLNTFLDICHSLCIKLIPIKQPNRYRYPVHINK